MQKNKKKPNKVGKVFGVIFSILLVAATMYLLFNLVKLNVLPTKLLFLYYYFALPQKGHFQKLFVSSLH